MISGVPSRMAFSVARAMNSPLGAVPISTRARGSDGYRVA